MTIKNMDHKETVRLLLSANRVMTDEYDIKPIKQKTLNGSFPRGVPAENLPEGFWEAWSKYTNSTLVAV